MVKPLVSPSVHMYQIHFDGLFCHRPTFLQMPLLYSKEQQEGPVLPAGHLEKF